MKLLSWNLHTRRGSAVLGDAVSRFGPDVILLQESGCPVDLPGTNCGKLVTGSKWGSWVVARAGHLTSMRIDGFEGWVAGGRLSGLGSMYVFSVHTPGSRPGFRRASYMREGRRLVDAIVARVPVSSTLIIGGDFNFSLGEPVDGDPRAPSAGERATIAAFRAQGFSIAWRDVHRDKPLAQTLRWMREPTTPYHCDGFLVRGKAVSLVSCDVLDDASLTAHSDHNPVLLALALRSAARKEGAP